MEEEKQVKRSTGKRTSRDEGGEGHEEQRKMESTVENKGRGGPGEHKSGAQGTSKENVENKEHLMRTGEKGKSQGGEKPWAGDMSK